MLEQSEAGAEPLAGLLFDGAGEELQRDDDGWVGRNFRIVAGRLEVGTYYLEVRGFNSGIHGDYRLEVSCSARTGAALPPAVAPSVAVGAIVAGDEGTEVPLGATVAGGLYDGAPEYAWTVSGGALDDPTSATPAWTRPTVNANASHTVELTVTVRGAGVNASDGTSDSVLASRSALVRVAGGDHGNLREHATAVSVPGTESGRLTYGDKDYFRFTLASRTRLSIWTTGSTDTSGELFDRNGIFLVIDGNSGPGQNFRVDPDLAAGDYFVFVTLQAGSKSTNYPYTLRLAEHVHSRPRIIASRLARRPAGHRGRRASGMGPAHGRIRRLRRRTPVMTPISDAGGNPMSAITIRAMADLGYEVDVTRAQSYRLPGTQLGRSGWGFGGRGCSAAGGSGGRGRSGGRSYGKSSAPASSRARHAPTTKAGRTTCSRARRGCGRTACGDAGNRDSARRRHGGAGHGGVRRRGTGRCGLPGLGKRPAHTPAPAPTPNRPDSPLFDGSYAVLEVRRITASGFQGVWRSAVDGLAASGHFCAWRSGDAPAVPAPENAKMRTA